MSFFQGKTGRLEVYSVFSYQRPEKDIKEILDQESAVKGSLSYVLFHSENLNLAQGVLGRWMNYYSARFLFFEGDWSNPRHGVPYSGVLLLADSVLLLLGLVALSKAGNSKSALFVWYLLLLSSLPAALSRDSIHAVRSLNMLFPLVFILALGASFVVENKKKLNEIFARVNERSEKFLKRKHKKVEQFQKLKEVEMMKECSFDPQLTPNGSKWLSKNRKGLSKSLSSSRMSFVDSSLNGSRGSRQFSEKFV